MYRDTQFFNNEEGAYSRKRYPLVDTDFNHFYFKKRRSKLMELLEKIVRETQQELSVLEIGCADGVMLRELHRQYPQFTTMLGVDLAEGMIADAQRLSPKEIAFSQRGTAQFLSAYNVIIEVGVLHARNIEEEFCFVSTHLHPNGYYICTLASQTSIRSILKANKERHEYYLPFSAYRKLIEKYFFIEHSEVYGLFIPFLWKIPVVARMLQPILEVVFRPFVQGLFHEKILVLRPKKQESAC